MICHVLINGLDTCPKRVWSSDFVDDHFLDRSCVIFPGSRGCRFPGSCADKSRDVQVVEGSHDELRVGSCHSQTTVSDRVWGFRDSGILDEITKMDFREGSFPKGNSVM